MAIGIKNDYGKVVAAVGAPGSFADVMTRYPKLVARLIVLHDSRALISEAVQTIVDSGVTNDEFVPMLLTAAYYLPSDPKTGAVCYSEWVSNEKQKN